MTAPFKRSTNFPGGIAAGQPEDGNWSRTNQQTTIAKKVGSSTETMTLPAGTIIWQHIYYPDHDAPATAGTFDLDDTTNTVKYVDDGDCTAAVNAAVSSPTRLTAAATFTITPTSMAANTFFWAGLVVTLPASAP